MISRQRGFCDLQTGLRDRQYLEERLSEEFARAERTVGMRLSILAVDVSEDEPFGAVDNPGAIGEVLTLTARTLVRNLRFHDVCCRADKTEFVAILVNVDSEQCQTVKTRIYRLMERTRCDFSPRFVFRIGVATWPEQGLSSDELITTAMIDKERARGISAI